MCCVPTVCQCVLDSFRVCDKVVTIKSAVKDSTVADMEALAEELLAKQNLILWLEMEVQWKAVADMRVAQTMEILQGVAVL